MIGEHDIVTGAREQYSDVASDKAAAAENQVGVGKRSAHRQLPDGHRFADIAGPQRERACARTAPDEEERGCVSVPSLASQTLLRPSTDPGVL